MSRDAPFRGRPVDEPCMDPEQLKGANGVASKTKQTWLIRDRKHQSNRKNLKKHLKQVRKNLEVLAAVSAAQ